LEAPRREFVGLAATRDRAVLSDPHYFKETPDLAHKVQTLLTDPERTAYNDIARGAWDGEMESWVLKPGQDPEDKQPSWGGHLHKRDLNNALRYFNRQMRERARRVEHIREAPDRAREERRRLKAEEAARVEGLRLLSKGEKFLKEKEKKQKEEMEARRRNRDQVEALERQKATELVAAERERVKRDRLKDQQKRKDVEEFQKLLTAQTAGLVRLLKLWGGRGQGWRRMPAWSEYIEVKRNIGELSNKYPEEGWQEIASNKKEQDLVTSDLLDNFVSQVLGETDRRQLAKNDEALYITILKACAQLYMSPYRPDYKALTPEAVIEKKALEAELQDLELTRLKERGRKAGVDEAILKGPDDADDFKTVVIALIVERELKSEVALLDAEPHDEGLAALQERLHKIDALPGYFQDRTPGYTGKGAFKTVAHALAFRPEGFETHPADFLEELMITDTPTRPTPFI
jgi:hypothetical protein